MNKTMKELLNAGSLNDFGLFFAGDDFIGYDCILIRMNENGWQWIKMVHGKTPEEALKNLSELTELQEVTNGHSDGG